MTDNVHRVDFASKKATYGKTKRRPSYVDPMQDAARWLADTGFPVDWTTDEMPPQGILDALAGVYAQQEDLSVAQALDFILAEGNWPVH